ncbi:MAG: ABC transporter permease [Candidatus Omnitrophota bacterium]
MMKRIAPLILSLAATAAIVSLFLWICGYSPWTVFYTLATGAFNSWNGFLLTLTKTALLILTGLAVAVPYRAGLFNIGGEGQLYLGGLAAAILGTMPLAAMGPLHWIACLLIGSLCGALWGGLAALLKTRRGVHEVISTIMLNFIAFHAVNELTAGVFSAGPGTSRTEFIQASAQLPTLLVRGGAQTSWGVAISFVIALLLSWGLRRTWPGFELRAVGNNPAASSYAGIACGRVRLYAMLIGGGCAGLAGAMETAGATHTFYERFTGGAGFDGIAVAFLALCEPWAVIPAAMAIAALRASDRSLQLELGIPKEIVFMLEGILIISLAVFTRRRRYD